MKEYHKIQSIFKRDPETKFKTFLMGEYSLPEFDYLKSNTWVWTEKVDGANIRVHWDCNTVTFGGRTDKAQIPAKLFKRLQELFPVDKFLTLGHPMTIYGEGYGNGIQKMGPLYNESGLDFVAFDIALNGWILKREDVEDICAAFGINVVPIVGEGTLIEAIDYVQSKPQSVWGSFEAEGIVLRPKLELITRGGERIITKIKVMDFK